jgi:CsoR family transcriptional regulator, copper-sensing transcriptional repressor
VTETHVHGYTHRKDEVLKRLRRIEGQTRGLQRMVEEDTYCIDVLTQVAAVTKALQAVSLNLLEDHMNHCVVDAARSSEAEGRAKVDEALGAITRLVRS